MDSPRLVCPYVLRTRRNAAPHVQVTAGKLREWQLRHRVQEGSRASSKHARLHGPLLVPDISGLSRFIAPLMFQGCACALGVVLLRGRCARLSWEEGEREALPMVVGSKLVPKESRMAARRMVRWREGKTLAGLGPSSH